MRETSDTSHIDAGWSNQGDTFSVAYRGLCYHFRPATNTHLRCMVVDRLDRDASIPGHTVTIPQPVRDTIRAEGYALA